MRFLFAAFNLCLFALSAQTRDSFDIYTFSTPAGWKTEKADAYVAFKKDNGAQYVNSYIFRPRPSSGSNQADFEADWRTHAGKYGLAQPEKVTTTTQDGWQMSNGAGTATFQRQKLIILVSTRTAQGQTYAVLHYFNDLSFGEEVAALTNSVRATLPGAAPPITQPASSGSSSSSSGGMMMAKFNTTFDDGWVATPKADYVQVTKGQNEVRLYYVNDSLEQARPQNIDPVDYYWQQIVSRTFRTAAPQKYVGVNYPPIYFGEAVGPAGYVALKVVYAGGARVIVSVTPNQNVHRQLFPQPNDLDRMLNYNRFGVTARDMIGTWVKSGGGGVEYYNAYTGSYAGMSAISTTDEFVFNGNGSYRSKHRSANTNNGSTTFSGLDYQGNFTVSDWEVLATNRVGGKTKKFWARLEAIKNGYLLILTDSDYEPLQYILYRIKQ